MILFVDFDGVLHPGNPIREDRRFTKVGLLADWLRRWPQVRVVVSSAWRKIHTLEELQAFFPEDVRDRVIGVTPVLEWDPFANHAGPSYERETEIRQWLRASSEPWAPWAAVDDSPWLFRPFTAELVVVDQAVGLTPEKLIELEGALGLVASPFQLLSAAQLADRLCISESAVVERERAGELYTLSRHSGGSGGYPEFQSWPSVEGESLRLVLSALATVEVATVHGFFSSANDLLGGLTPVEAIVGNRLNRSTPLPDVQRFLDRSFPDRLAEVVAAAIAYRANL